jgi:hypothetical protein
LSVSGASETGRELEDQLLHLLPSDLGQGDGTPLLLLGHVNDPLLHKNHAPLGSRTKRDGIGSLGIERQLFLRDVQGQGRRRMLFLLYPVPPRVGAELLGKLLQNWPGGLLQHVLKPSVKGLGIDPGLLVLLGSVLAPLVVRLQHLREFPPPLFIHNVSLFYNRLQPLTGLFRGKWNTQKCKNPVFLGVFHMFKFYEAAALTSELRRQSYCQLSTWVTSRTATSGTFSKALRGWGSLADGDEE